MARHYILGIFVLLSCSLLEAYPSPTLNEKTGPLGNAEKIAALGDAASKTSKLVEEIGDNIDTLYKKDASATATRKYGDLASEGGPENDDIGEDGIDADGSTATADYSDENISLIAEAKPIGSAVIGDHGLTAARPVGTAVAAAGVALAGASAGGSDTVVIDPAILNLKYLINYSQ